MQDLVPIKVIKAVEMVYDILKLPFEKFSLFSKSKSVSFEEKLDFVKKLTPKDVNSIKVAIHQKIMLGKILEGIMKEIDSPFYKKKYVNAQSSDLATVLNEFQSQLINLLIRYEATENRVLLHYSQFPTYSRDWNNSTRYSRGIVIDLDDYNVVVHPYDKFFNYLEMKETKDENLPDLPYEAATKLDGSEGILYPAKNGDLRIITKGGFHTDQGKFATELLWSKYAKQAQYVKDSKLFDYYTFTFEILYAQDDPNRIVVAYNDADLRLIGVKDLKTHQDLSYAEVIKMAKELGFAHTELEDITLEEILEEREKRENFEGWVVRFSNGLYMKIKCKAYLDLHGARFGSSIKSVFVLLKEEKWDDFISSIPEEIKHVPEALQKRVIKFARYQTKKAHDLYLTLPQVESQKDFAIYVNQNIPKEFRDYMFKIRSGKEVNVFDSTWLRFKAGLENWENKQSE
ncbi:RNA ligase and tail fiber protein attachment catalyst [Bacillus phage G]|uniref:Gp265 n=1 Tax=Bacillus phage G TaxID=2884420 RepID=G3MA06_9CAUD|nr:RNA ligase and tail fiber protein attachment catalyst [Bacillus phage G]AEO93524.1 gp265 [Bacillus phage G]